MGSWIVHSIIGIMLGIACIAFNTGMEQTSLFAAVISTVLGSLIPDIDHKKSKVRQGFRWLVIISLMLIVYLSLSSYFDIKPDLTTITAQGVMLLMLVFAASVFIAAIITMFIESLIPKHRGPVHRIFASLIFSFLIYALAIFLGFENAAIIALWGFLGYLSHIFIDILI